VSVPLSEDEQRILHQIEQQFYESDPDFARSVSQTTIYRHAFRNIKWGVLLFCGGVVMLLLTLSVHFLLAFVGVLIMLVALIFIERNARKLGKAGMEQMTRSMRAKGVRDAFGNAGQRMRDRFKRED
jgi:Flp pilus assembly protein TadB